MILFIFFNLFEIQIHMRLIVSYVKGNNKCSNYANFKSVLQRDSKWPLDGYKRVRTRSIFIHI
jgi:hypothetical protein